LGVGLVQRRFGQWGLGGRLIGGGLERSGVDREQEVARLDRRALGVILTHEVTGDSSSDLRVDGADQRADILDGDRHVALHHRLNLDDGCRRRCGRTRGVATTGGDDRRQRDQRNRKQPAHIYHASAHYFFAHRASACWSAWIA